jgi:hypothetical protein
MKTNIRAMFLLLIILQALHSAEEFIFRFYERFPPMIMLYQNATDLARPAFVIGNTLLVTVGLVCFVVWVRPAQTSARVVVWVWIAIESFNVLIHFGWAILSGGYNPGLVTAVLFVPVLSYLVYLMMRN